MGKKIGLTVLLAALSGVASAAPSSCKPIVIFGWTIGQTCTSPGKPPVAAPEVDPASALTGLTLALGGLAVLRGRRFKATAA